eukprot:5171776-Alexandrium_andersonii.AAC.1
MSASLVGSEMCIRDRNSVAGAKPERPIPEDRPMSPGRASVRGRVKGCGRAKAVGRVGLNDR